MDGDGRRCSVAGCSGPGEFRAPMTPSTFDGPGQWRFLCLDHVRAHNASYNYFAGMSPEEIEAAQSPIAGWERTSRAFATQGADPAPSWAQFRDPLDAIAARFRPGMARRAVDRFSATERHALGVLGLADDVDLHGVRRRYSDLVRRYHPDRNGGDRRHEAELRKVIAAWQTLRKAPAFS